LLKAATIAADAPSAAIAWSLRAFSSFFLESELRGTPADTPAF
jgi:hypothetical protein